MSELKADRSVAHGVVKTASTAPEVKEAVKAAGLDDNQSALLATARCPGRAGCPTGGDTYGVLPVPGTGPVVVPLKVV